MTDDQLHSDPEETYRAAVEVIHRDRKGSTSYLRRVLRIGYNHASRIMERLESEGIVSEANHIGKREVLIAPPAREGI